MNNVNPSPTRFPTSMRQHPIRFMLALLAAIVMLLGAPFIRCADAEAPASLSFTMKSVERHSTLTDETYWKCSYPVFSGSGEVRSINRILQAAVTGSDRSKPLTPPLSPEAAAESFIREFDTFRKEMPDGMPWQSETLGEVVLNRSGRLTVVISTDAYTGGAHGIGTSSCFVFDTKSGRQLSLRDLFVPGFEHRLDALIDRRFRQIKGLSATDRLDSEQGTLFENVIRHNDNFALTDKGIMFHYNPYEIAAYVYGYTQVDLGWRDLKGIMKP